MPLSPTDRHTRGLCTGFAAAMLLAGAFLALAARPANAEEPATWQVGPDFRQQLAASVSVSWSERPLREALTSLSRSTRVAVFLDRRIDPGQPIDLAVADQPLNVLFKQVAAEIDAGVAAVGPVVYLGPRSTAARLASLAEMRRKEAAAAPAGARTKLLRTQAWRSEEAAEPRQLAADLAEQAGVSITNLDLLPHDVWPAVHLPALPWTERMTLLLAGFDLTYSLSTDGTQIILTAMPEAALVEKTYRPRTSAADAAAQLRQLLPGATIRTSDGKLTILASVEDHERVEQLLAGKTVRTTQVAPGEKRYTMEVKNQPLGAVVNTIAKRLGKKLVYDPAIAPKLRELTSLSVKEVTLEELMDEALTPRGLTFKLGEESLEVIEKSR